MPTYEYLCSSCGNTWEEVQKISEPALEVCPKCSKHTAKRQISAGNFILKGGGWYADAYSSAKPARKDEGGSSDKSSDTKSSDTKSSDAQSSDSRSSDSKSTKDGGSSTGDTKSGAKAEGTTPAKKADSVAPKAPKASGTSSGG